MAIFVKTANPTFLVQSIRDKIKENKIQTWAIDQDGDFTHVPEQWKNKAWMTAEIEADRVVFSIIGRRSVAVSVTDYAIYHGRFVEMLLDNFDNQCLSIEVTPLATKYDIISLNKSNYEKPI